MDYRRASRLAQTTSWVVAAGFFISVSYHASAGYGTAGTVAIVVAIFFLTFMVRRAIVKRWDAALLKRAMSRGATRLLSDFTERVRTCFTMPELVNAIRDDLEKKLDASVILIKSNTWEPVYTSPATLTSDPGLLAILKRNFRELSEGMGFMDDRFSLTVRMEASRGFFVFCKGYYLFVFSRSCAEVDHDAFRVLYGELLIFFDRVLTVARLFQIAALSKEWRLIAETQKTFLPQKLPEHPKLELSAYFRPLVNVSGDFYDAIQLDDDRFLLVMGDVSGKGLAAALIMGIALNTIRAAQNKADLQNIIRNCHNAIREMGFDDKYIVLFLGLADLKKHTLRYVNAAMPDQFLVVRTVKGPVVRRLESNTSIVGLTPLDSVEVEEIELRTDDVVILSTDGLLELDDQDGRPLDGSPEFQRILTDAAGHSAEDLVDSLATLGETYVGDKQLRDDITILVGKVGRLWD
ncbi:MAG: SpoIIE family protein phosphatase [Spirochaetales bacterium]|nr:SpoIIE family protein phosphatase [Spirochaetales bacterium]MBP7264153.1 SpoIIE family protein phosphatase [Spirochaetia bacterium]